MMRNKLAKVVLTVGALHSGLVSALGLGELALDSSLNQPFRAEIPLRDIGGLSVDQIKVQLADATAFENAGVDRSQFLSSLQFEVELLNGGNGRIIVTTTAAVVEPYLDFIVEARWPNGKMIREYTVLLDLPVYADAAPVKTVDVSTASAAPVNTPVEAAPVAPSPAPASPVRELGGSIGAADRVAPAPRSIEQRQDLPVAEKSDEYRVQHRDTMWRIASKHRPSSYVTTQQTMLALVKKNPQAFVNGNVNRLKSGYVLSLPTEAEVKAIRHESAVEEIRIQAKEWRGERVARSSSSDSATAPASTQSSVTPMAPQLDATDKKQAPKTESTEQDVKFSIGSAGDAAEADGEVAALRAKVREEQENLEKSKLENGAMQSRVVEMEKQIEALQSLIALKNTQLAALQSGAQAPSSEMSAESLAELEETALAALPKPSEAESGAAALEQEAAGDASELSETVADKTKGKKAANPSPAKPAEPPASDSTLDSAKNWISQNIALFAGLLLALLALLVLIVKRRQNADDDTDLADFDEDLSAENESPVLFASGGEFDEGAEKAVSPFAEEHAADVFNADDFDFDKLEDDSAAQDAASDDVVFADDSVFDEHKANDAADSPGLVPQTGDVVAEAEIYVAYGRYDQAASLLKTAIEQDPENIELRLKLIDIYLDTRDQDNFEVAYGELRALNDDAAVARVKESMSAIEGVSHWLGDDGSSTGADNTINVGHQSAVDESADLDFDIGDELESVQIDEGDIDFELDDSLNADTNSETSTVSALDMTQLGEADASDADTLESLDVDLADLDFDFEGDFGTATSEAAPAEASTAPSEELSPLSASTDETEELEELSLEELEDAELDLGELDVLEVGDEPAAIPESDDDILSFDDEEVASLELGESDSADIELDELTLDDGELSVSNFENPEPEAVELGTTGLGDTDITEIAAPTLDSGDLTADANGVSAESDDDELELDLSELDMDLAEPSAASSVAETVTDASDDGLDLDLSEFDMPSETAGGATTEELDDLEVDESFFLDDDSDAEDEQRQPSSEDAPVLAAPAADLELPATDGGDAISVEDLVFDEFDAGDDEVDGFESIVDSESVATKLDLARAYIDMGDSEGAREMLEEVLQEGDAQQQADAKSLLDNIG